MKRLLLWLVLARLAGAVALTTVTDTIRDPNGNPVSGTAYIRISQGCRFNGIQVAPKTMVVQFTAGNFSVNLTPNDACFISGTTAGTSYNVFFLVDAGAPTYQQNWLVPTSGSPVTIPSVLITSPTTPPTPPWIVQLQQLAQGGATTGQVPAWNGTRWAPVNQSGGGGGGAVDSVFGRTGVVAAQSGDYTAAQVTNAVDSTGTYSNPSWLTALAWSKLTGLPSLTNSFNGRSGAVAPTSGDYTAAQVTNAVDSTGSYNNPSWITALAWSKLSGSPPSIVTNAVDSTAMYANPSWITSLAWSKLTGVPSITNTFNGRSGTVTPTTGDYTAAQVTNAVDSTQFYSNPSWFTTLAWSKLTGLPSLTNTFNGRSGTVVPTTGDYTAAQVTNAAQINAGNTFTTGTQDLSGAAHTLPEKKGTIAGLPMTCTVGEKYFATDAAVAGGNDYYCTATNTWTVQATAGTAVGGVNAVQGSDGFGHFTDTGCTSSAGVLGCFIFSTLDPNYSAFQWTQAPLIQPFDPNTFSIFTLASIPASWQIGIGADPGPGVVSFGASVTGANNKNYHPLVSLPITGTDPNILSAAASPGAAGTFLCLDGNGGATGCPLKSAKTFNLIDVTDTSLSGFSKFALPAAFHITRVYCSVAVATSVTINLDARVLSAANTDTGSHALPGGDLVCTQSGADTGAISVSEPADKWIALVTIATSAAAIGDSLSVNVEYTTP